MNERIKELYITAMREDCGEKWDTQEEFIERFAELIVRECAEVCDELQKWPSTEPRHCASDILKHFGIEE